MEAVALLSKLRPRLTFANVVSLIALFVALGGSSYAALKVTSRNVPKDALTGADIKNLTGRDVRNNSLTGADVKNLRSNDVKDSSLLAQDFAPGQLPKGDTGPPGPSTGPAGGALAGSYPNPGLAPPEAWHEVSTFGTCSISPVVPWENYGASLATAAYYRDPLGVVRLKGSVKCAGPAGDYTIFNLPQGYRPAAIQYFPARANFGTESNGVAVVTSGQVTLSRGTSSCNNPHTHLSLDAVSFRCGPSGQNGCP
jgi:hypothetical protein